nr:signal peptidase I [Enterococcus sp. 665A]
MAGLFVICYLLFLGSFRMYYWLYPKYFVSGESMNPTYWEQEVVQVKAHHKPKRFDVVVLHPPDAPTELYLKRVIGLPGERIDYKEGQLFVDGKFVADQFASTTEDFDWNDSSDQAIPKGYYFVLGDNRIISKDSRIFGLVSEKQILGIVQEGNTKK